MTFSMETERVTRMLLSEALGSRAMGMKFLLMTDLAERGNPCRMQIMKQPCASLFRGGSILDDEGNCHDKEGQWMGCDTNACGIPYPLIEVHAAIPVRRKIPTIGSRENVAHLIPTYEDLSDLLTLSMKYDGNTFPAGIKPIGCWIGYEQHTSCPHLLYFLAQVQKPEFFTVVEDKYREHRDNGFTNHGFFSNIGFRTYFGAALPQDMMRRFTSQGVVRVEIGKRGKILEFRPTGSLQL